MNPQHNEVANLVSQLQTAIRERTKLLAQRRAMIHRFKSTNERTDPEVFNGVIDRLTLNAELIAGLRAALFALGRQQ